MATGVDDGFTPEEWESRKAAMRAQLAAMLDALRPKLEALNAWLNADDDSDANEQE